MTPFPFQALKVVAGGQSALDIDGLELKTDAEAYQFLLSYGFDLYEASHLEQLGIIYDRALRFCENYLCAETCRLPEIFRGLSLAENLKPMLLCASGIYSETWRVDLRPWVCALLRVMHVVSHLQSDLRLKYLPKIKRQTVDRIAAHIQQNGTEIFLGFEADKVPLVAFQKKESKVRDAVIMKLLHKASATAQEIHDHLGVRFITRNRVDTMRVIQYLINHHLVAFPNVMSVRCRNTMIDPSELQILFERHKGDWNKIAEQESGLSVPSLGEKNPFSSSIYKSIQFTTRQLIRIPVIRKGGQKREMSFFFPIEFQLMDEKSFQEAESGEAGHAVYKQRQLEAVRKRVLRGLSF